MVSFTGDATGLKIYINGVLSKSGGSAYAPPNTTNSLWIGIYDPTAEVFNGKISDVRIYNRVLSSTEFTALYRQYNPSVNAASGENGLVGWWKMAGNTKDATPHANNCTNTAATLTTDRKGQANSAYSFNGTSSQLACTATGLPNINGAQTVSAWVDLTGTGARDFVASYRGGSANQFRVVNGTVQVSQNGGTVSIASTSTITTNVWHHLVYTFDGTTMKLYIDGSLNNTSTPTLQTGATSNLYVGWDGYGEYWQGYISDVRVYNRAISSADVSNLYKSYNSQISLYAGGSGVNLVSGLIGYWPFSGNAKDATPYSDNGSVSGATLTTDRFGNANSAYSFNGTNNYIDLGNPSSRFNLANFTISAWIKDSDITKTARVVYGYNGTTQFYGVTVRPSGYVDVVVRCSDGTLYDLSSSNPISQGVWVHVVGTRQAGVGLQLYINGASAATPLADTNTTAVTLPAGLYVGWDPQKNSTTPFNGSFDSVRLYNRALSSTEVSALYGERD